MVRNIQIYIDRKYNYVFVITSKSLYSNILSEIISTLTK